MNFTMNHRVGQVRNVPACLTCKSEMRPNVIMKHDVNVVETLHMKMQDNYEKFETKNDNRSLTIIEIGASPAFPQVRRLAETKLLNDKVRCCLIRINPIKERQSLYNWEEREITKII